MIAAGYLLKRVVPPPEWLVETPTHIRDVCSVSNCVNDDIVDVQDRWLHNGFGLGNDGAALRALAEVEGLDLTDVQLFYYTAYELELTSDGWTFDPAAWRPRTRLETAVVPDEVVEPAAGSVLLLGYDVVVYEYGSLVHSPLSCNSVVKSVPVNEHCLFETFDEAREAIDGGKFGGGCESGAYTILSVSLVEPRSPR